MSTLFEYAQYSKYFWNRHCKDVVLKVVMSNDVFGKNAARITFRSITWNRIRQSFNSNSLDSFITSVSMHDPRKTP